MDSTGITVPDSIPKTLKLLDRLNGFSSADPTSFSGRDKVPKAAEKHYAADVLFRNDPLAIRRLTLLFSVRVPCQAFRTFRHRRRGRPCQTGLWIISAEKTLRTSFPGRFLWVRTTQWLRFSCRKTADSKRGVQRFWGSWSFRSQRPDEKLCRALFNGKKGFFKEFLVSTNQSGKKLLCLDQWWCSAFIHSLGKGWFCEGWIMVYQGCDFTWGDGNSGKSSRTGYCNGSSNHQP